MTDDDPTWTLNALKQAETDAEWNAVCDRVKAANGGDYPSDWYEKVIKTGIQGGFEARKEMAAARRRRAKYK